MKVQTENKYRVVDVTEVTEYAGMEHKVFIGESHQHISVNCDVGKKSWLYVDADFIGGHTEDFSEWFSEFTKSVNKALEIAQTHDTPASREGGDQETADG